MTIKLTAPINTAPADRALTASDKATFDKVTHRREIARAKRRFFAAGGKATVYAAGTSLPVGRYLEGLFGRRIYDGRVFPALA